MANSLIEAMACGRPTLAADIEGNRSLVAQEASGLLFRDAAELQTMAERLVVDAGLRARLGAAGRAFVAVEFPPAREIDGYVDVYRDLVPAVVR